MFTRFALLIAWIMHFLPLRILNPMGQGLGLLFLALGRERREVARTNLRRCFPWKGELEREQLLRDHFRAFGRAVLESIVVWWGSERRIRNLVQVEGLQHLREIGDRRRILLVPHFNGIEQTSIRLNLEMELAAIYARQKNAVFDRFLLRHRIRFGHGRLLLRTEGIKPIIRAVRDGLQLQLSPDLDLGPKDSIFVPFFGVPAATVTVLPRLARLCDAVIVPVIARQLPGGQGYRAEIQPPWEDYPTHDVEADVRRMNAFIEARILEQPSQYMWMHKRFKTQPYDIGREPRDSAAAR